jgi:hypothetical protein
MQIAITPGQNVYLWIRSTSVSFGSFDYHLVVPLRNSLNYSGAGTVSDNKFTIQAVLADQGAVFSLANLAITNGTAQDLREGNVFDVYPVSDGPVTVLIPANSLINNSFASNLVQVNYDSNPTAIPGINKNSFSIYPNPNNSGIVYIKAKTDIPTAIDIYSASGSFIRTLVLNKDENQEINLQDLQKGMYVLRIHTSNGLLMEKLILK